MSEKSLSRKITAEFPTKYVFTKIGDSLSLQSWKYEQAVINSKNANFLIGTLTDGERVSISLGANLKKVMSNLDDLIADDVEVADGIRSKELYVKLSYVKDIPSNFISNPTKIFKAEILEVWFDF